MQQNTKEGKFVIIVSQHMLTTAPASAAAFIKVPLVIFFFATPIGPGFSDGCR